MVRFLGSFVLSVGLLTPVIAVNGQDRQDRQDRHDQVAQEHRWNESENEHWRQYLKEHHKKEHDWAKSKKREQEDYWKWRDAHR